MTILINYGSIFLKAYIFLKRYLYSILIPTYEIREVDEELKVGRVIQENDNKSTNVAIKSL